jgi:GT2 family glycosyltransferase
MSRASVVVPALNEAKNLASWLPKLRGQLTVSDELLVVDNGSTDETASAAREGGAQVVLESRRGRARARNAGIRVSRGEFLVFVDADCRPEASWLENLIAPFADPGIGCVAGEIALNDNESSLGQYLADKRYLAQSVNLDHPFLPFAATGNVAFRREALDRIGYFDESLIDGEDADLCWRMQLQTGYRITIASNAVVRHLPALDARALFRQKLRHARAAALLYKKYRGHWAQAVPSMKKVYWEYRSILLRAARFGGEALAARVYLCKSPLPADGYQLLLETAEKLGRLQGAIRHHVWYP